MIRDTRWFLIPLSLAIACFLVAGSIGGCQLDNLKPFSEMSPKEKATFFLSVYNSSDVNYRAMAARPDLTEVQKETLRKKREIMVAVYPLLKSYSTYVEGGVIPSPELEQAVLNHIDQLTTLVVE